MPAPSSSRCSSAPSARVRAADNAAAADTPTDSTNPRKEPLEEVVVTGMRANLEKSLDAKRTAPVVLDSIDSTELGRFPDADVADSLEHLPGITIQRTTGGEGQKITVRGLSCRVQHRDAQQPHPRERRRRPRSGLRRAARRAHHRRGRAEVRAGLRASRAASAARSTCTPPAPSTIRAFMPAPTPRATGTTCRACTAASTPRS